VRESDDAAVGSGRQEECGTRLAQIGVVAGGRRCRDCSVSSADRLVSERFWSRGTRTRGRQSTFSCRERPGDRQARGDLCHRTARGLSDGVWQQDHTSLRRKRLSHVVEADLCRFSPLCEYLGDPDGHVR
jgi:hypothetical protein